MTEDASNADQASKNMSNTPPPIKLMTERQFAEAIAVSPRTARRLRSQKIIPFYKFGKGIVRYDQDQCRKALEKYRVEAHGETRPETSAN